MASFRISHLTTPEVLNAIHPRRLSRFLAPYNAFLTQRRIRVPKDPDRGPWDTAALAQVFLSPDHDTPPELFDALYYVDRLANPNGMSALIAATQRAGLNIDCRENYTPADFAMQVWLERPELLERIEAEQYLEHPRSFEYYHVESDHPNSRLREIPRSPERMQAFESELNDWYQEHRRGRTVKVFVVDRTDSLWFLIRHGEPFKREESIRGSKPSSVAYRPLKYDVVVYDRPWRELRINALLKGQRLLYRRTIGHLLFGVDAEFIPAEKYDLEPLRQAGDQSLVCSDVDGIESVRLRELQYDWGGRFDEQQIDKAEDLFAAMRDRNRTIPDTPRLVRAVFSIQFHHANRPRSVTIKVPDKALYQRDADGAFVEQWLRRRGFLRIAPHAEPNEEGGTSARRKPVPAAHPPLAGT